MSKYNDRLDADVERADAKIQETRARVAAHLGRSRAVTGKAGTPNGAISVEVGPGGRLLEVNIENSALTMRPELLAATLVDLARRATRNAGSRMQQSVRSVVSPPVSDSLAQLGFTPRPDEEVDWADVIRRTR
jgi:DNA-binding protein YbaB